MKDFYYKKVHYFISEKSTGKYTHPCIRIDAGNVDDSKNGKIPPRDEKNILIGYIESEPKLIKIIEDLGWKTLSIRYEGITLCPTTHELINFLKKI